VFNLSTIKPNMFPPIKLKSQTETWTIKQLLELNRLDKLNLSPHYQRNAIWSLPMQRQLIESIQKGYPLPNFFVRETRRNQFEMVDGQQRGRSIIGFWNGEFSDNNSFKMSDEIRKTAQYRDSIDSFLSYKLDVCVVDNAMTDLEVERFYVLVNKSGMRLNRPELRKAEFYSTRFLKLATKVANDSLFGGLSLFSDSSVDRMNDVDFASELLAFLKSGFSDKKEKVDAIYASDISEREFQELETQITSVLKKIKALDDATPIEETRFKQRGDFYTLFSFVHLNPEVPAEMLLYCYNTILALSPHIKPSQEECDPLMNYAINCVSQSNSKRAREGRHQFFVDLFLNKDSKPTPAQKAIGVFYSIPGDSYVRKWGFLLLDLNLLSE